MYGMTTPREPARSGSEQDVVTRWRRVHCYTRRAGVCSKIKRAIRRRERKSFKQMVQSEDFKKS